MVVLIVTPCFAQEVKPEGMLSVDGTLWSYCAVGFIISIPPFFGILCGEIGFYQGNVYFCYNDRCSPSTDSYYDLGVVSIAYAISQGYFALAIIQPNGFGVRSEIEYHSGTCPGYHCSPPSFVYDIGIMFKINDNWTPQEIE
jgi:hypothetical protein